jgi:hypothetical protein
MQNNLSIEAFNTTVSQQNTVNTARNTELSGIKSLMEGFLNGIRQNTATEFLVGLWDVQNNVIEFVADVGNYSNGQIVNGIELINTQNFRNGYFFSAINVGTWNNVNFGIQDKYEWISGQFYYLPYYNLTESQRLLWINWYENNGYRIYFTSDINTFTPANENEDYVVFERGGRVFNSVQVAGVYTLVQTGYSKTEIDNILLNSIKQSDWNQTDDTQKDFIKNKPLIPTKTSDLTNDSDFTTNAILTESLSGVNTNISTLQGQLALLNSLDFDITGTVQTYSLLPSASSVASGSVYSVLKSSGSGISKKNAGFYKSNGSTWILMLNLELLMELIGNQNDLINGKVDKVQGYGLTENDLTNFLKGEYDIAYTHSKTTGNPHGATKSDIGLGDVDNTADVNKPISSATQTALNLKADSDTVYTKSEVDTILKNQNRFVKVTSNATITSSTPKVRCISEQNITITIVLDFTQQNDDGLEFIILNDASSSGSINVVFNSNLIATVPSNTNKRFLYQDNSFIIFG